MRSIRNIYKHVKDFLFGSLNKEFLIFLFFLFLSGVFWLMMTLNETYEKELPVLMRISGVPRNVVMTSEETDTVYVTVRDKGFVILSYLTSDKLRPIVVNFSTYANRQAGQGQIPIADLQRFIRQQLSASSTIVSIKADCLDFYFNYGRNKEVKVVLAGNIIPANNYYLAHSQITPEKVTVYASEELLDSIDAVSTDYLNIVNFSDTVIQTVKLKSMVGVKIVPQTVKLTLYPDVLTEESVEVPITAVNLPAGITIRTFPQRVRVRFNVGASMYRTVKASDFQVVVDYKEVATSSSDKCKLYLYSKPSGVANARLDIEQVDYLIEQ